ncbi:MAG: RluA family pseudouridine synthase [Acutalibacteraceae bacterium]
MHTQGARQAQRQAREGKLSADRGRRAHAVHPRGIHAGRRGGARADRRVPAHPAVGQRRIRGRKPAHCRQKRGCWCIPTGSANTLIDHIQAYLYRKGEYDPRAEHAFAPALCNRIDRNTCGLVIAAKNAAALREMNEIIRERDVKKLYLAAAKGRFAEKSGRLVSYLEKLADENRVVVKDKKNGAGDKKAVSLYTVLGYNEKLDVSLLEIELVTGRTHQIRAQLAAAGHPLLGDGKYAVNRGDRRLGYVHQALCAYTLAFDFAAPHELLGYLKGREFHAARPYFLELF